MLRSTIVGDQFYGQQATIWSPALCAQHAFFTIFRARLTIRHTGGVIMERIMITKIRNALQKS